MAARPRIVITAARLLVLLMAVGSVMPSGWLWQCRHAARIVLMPQAVSSVMPCQMTAAQMRRMPCCQAFARNARGARTLSGPPCTPSWTQTAALPPAVLPSSFSVAHTFCDIVPSSFALLTPGVLRASRLGPICFRPPPKARYSPFPSFLTPSPRAPPAA